MNKIFILILFLAISISSWAGEIPGEFTLLENREPIQSTFGFSFVPPGGSNWYESFGRKEITYRKKTDLKTLTFYAGVIEGNMRSVIDDQKSLLALVKSMKDQWGKEKDRYQNTSASFEIAQEIGQFCVLYQLVAEDHKAKNLGGEKFLKITAKGVFCLLPNNKKHAVDIYYSSRSMPSTRFETYNLEGNNFINSLSFIGN